ncbi:MAG: hypothetical protein K2Y22_10520 [Candidatus Obscuribacterales bacterium]|nr:hypothetical protein [Candidatus Obscuribacterales bacterium]
MAEQYVSKAIELLRAEAKTNERAGNLAEAEHDYKTLLTLEEICGFPKAVIDSEKGNVQRCELAQTLKHMMEKSSLHLEALIVPKEPPTEVRGVNTCGKIRVKPSETVIIDTEKLYKEKQAKAAKNEQPITPDWEWSGKGCP